MSFVYTPIPGYSVHEKRQLHAGLAPGSAYLGDAAPGPGGGARRRSRAPTIPTQRFGGFLAHRC